MLKNAYLLAKIGADTAENERNLPKFCQKFGRSPDADLREEADAARVRLGRAREAREPAEAEGEGPARRDEEGLRGVGVCKNLQTLIFQTEFLLNF